MQIAQSNRGEGAAEGEGAGARGRVASEGGGERTVFDLHMCQLCFASFGTFYFRLTDGFLFGHQQNKQMLHATQCTRRRRSLHHFAPAATVDKSPRTHCASQSSSCPNSNSSLCLSRFGHLTCSKRGALELPCRSFSPPLLPLLLSAHCSCMLHAACKVNCQLRDPIRWWGNKRLKTRTRHSHNTHNSHSHIRSRLTSHSIPTA